MFHTFSACVHSHNNKILEVVNGSSDCAYPASSKGKQTPAAKPQLHMEKYTNLD